MASASCATSPVISYASSPCARAMAARSMLSKKPRAAVRAGPPATRCLRAVRAPAAGPSAPRPGSARAGRGTAPRPPAAAGCRRRSPPPPAAPSRARPSGPPVRIDGVQRGRVCGDCAEMPPVSAGRALLEPGLAGGGLGGCGAAAAATPARAVAVREVRMVGRRRVETRRVRREEGSGCARCGLTNHAAARMHERHPEPRHRSTVIPLVDARIFVGRRPYAAGANDFAAGKSRSPPARTADRASPRSVGAAALASSVNRHGRSAGTDINKKHPLHRLGEKVLAG